MALVHLQPHALELLLELLGGAFGGIGEEEEIFIFLVQPIHKFLHPGQKPVSVVDDAVHIADEAFVLPQCFHRILSFVSVVPIFFFTGYFSTIL